MSTRMLGCVMVSPEVEALASAGEIFSVVPPVIEVIVVD